MFVYRILLDPEPADAQGGATTAPAPETVTVSVAEYQAMQASAQQYQQQNLTDRQRIDQLEGQYRAEKVGGAIGDLLAGQQFISPQAAQQAKQLLANRAEVRAIGGIPTVVDRATGRPFNETAAEALRSPEFAHFLKADTRGGSGANLAPAYGAPGSANQYEAMGVDPANAKMMALQDAGRFDGVPGTQRYNQRFGNH